jgi:hypothetical protein
MYVPVDVPELCLCFVLKANILIMMSIISRKLMKIADIRGVSYATGDML